MDGRARLWHGWTGEALSRPLTHDRAVCWAAFSPDGERVVTASWDWKARIWNSQSGEQVVAPFQHGQCVLFAEFTRDGRRIVTAAEDGTGRFWDARTGQLLAPLMMHPGWVLRVRLNRAETLAATPSTDTTVRVWDVATDQLRFATHRHTRAVEEVQFSPDGQWLATASADHTVRLWDVRTGLSVGETLRHDRRVHILQFSPDGGRLLTGTTEDPACVWQLLRLTGPAPSWLPALAEAVAGYRLNALEQLEPVPVRELAALRDEVDQNHSPDPYMQWARWFFADRSTRRQSPGAAITVSDHVQRLLAQNTDSSLRQALRYSPTNRTAFARLAAVLRASNTKSNAMIAAQADWCEHQAKEPVPARD
jgi:hypothetical protein